MALTALGDQPRLERLPVDIIERHGAAIIPLAAEGTGTAPEAGGAARRERPLAQLRPL